MKVRQSCSEYVDQQVTRPSMNISIARQDAFTLAFKAESGNGYFYLILGQFRKSLDRLCDNRDMPKRSRMPTDLNSLASRIAEMATNEQPPADDGKDPAAVALGRKGGLKGGRARADKMTPEDRRESAKKAAAARWGKKKEEPA